MKKIALAALLIALFALPALLSANAFAQSQSYVQTIVSGGCSLPELDKPMSVLSDRPCLSAAFINEVLDKYGSPANKDKNGRPLKYEDEKSGKWFVKYSHDYGIDNAVALAIFKYESTWGTNSRWVGRPGGACSKGTKGIGNIKYNAGMPDFKCGTWSAYDSWEDSIKGFFDYLKNSRYYVKAGKTTIDEILPIYAPRSENDTDAYIRNVKTDVRNWRNLQRERVSNRIRLQRLLYAENTESADAPETEFANNIAGEGGLVFATQNIGIGRPNGNRTAILGVYPDSTANLNDLDDYLQFSLELPQNDSIQGYEIALYDVQGKQVLKKSLEQNKAGSTPTDMPAQSAGTGTTA